VPVSRYIRPPTTLPAKGGNILDWATQAQQTLRDIAAALRSDTPTPATKPTTNLPAVDTPQPFQLATVNTGTSESPNWKVRVHASTLAGGSSTDLGFAEGDDPPYLLTAEEGIVQGGITIDGSTGEVTSRWLEIVGGLSEGDDSTFYVEIGTVAFEEGVFTAANSRYGPITATICRNWFAAEAPYYGVTWQ
jgi:hypothetical protein